MSIKFSSFVKDIRDVSSIKYLSSVHGPHHMTCREALPKCVTA